MKSLALVLGLLVAVQALPANGPTPLDVYMPIIEGAPVPIPPKIVGGQPAVIGQFPHQAALLIDDSFSCGGSLIARDWVLTAAHCAPGASYKVILGSIKWQGTGGVTVVTTNRIVHPDYDPATISNDVALLHLPTPVTLTANIKLVVLPTAADASNTFAGVTALVSGFGRTSQTGAVSPDLMWVELPIINNTECAKTYGSIIIPSTICASGAEGRSTCSGDSGGPLVIDRGGSFTQIGVVSFVSSVGCSSGSPSGYARVTSFLDWIQEISGV